MSQDTGTCCASRDVSPTGLEVFETNSKSTFVPFFSVRNHEIQFLFYNFGHPILRNYWRPFGVA